MESTINDHDHDHEPAAWNEPAPLELGSDREEAPVVQVTRRRRWPLLAAVFLLGGGLASAAFVAALIAAGGLGIALYSSEAGLVEPIEAPGDRADATLIIMPDPAKDGGGKGEGGDKKGDKAR